MSGSVADRKRLLRITAGNLRQSHIYIGQHLDFFPDQCFGPSKQKRSEAEKTSHIQIALTGLNRSIETDIGCDKSTGKPRRFFRGRTWVKEFFAHHQLQTGDVLALERLSQHTYRLYPFDSRTDRKSDWHKHLSTQPRGSGPTVIELFAGCGGMALGFKEAGFRTILANEWDPSACESLRKNVTKRVAQCAIEEIEKFPLADVVAGGPPCQGFSNLGERVPNDPRNQLWRHFMRAVADAHPQVFVMENVPPLLKSQEFIEIKKIAESLGYQTEGRILNSADYGVPQTRKRAIIIGCKGFAPQFPPPTHRPIEETRQKNISYKPWVTVREAFAGLSLAPDGKNWHIGRNPTPLSLERYSHIPSGGNRWDLPLGLMPECWKRKLKGGTDLFGRLWWHRPSVTIRTEFYKPEKGRYLHPVADRPITHREAARLQSFPDSFDFQGSKIQVGIQIGNALPPVLASVIAIHVRELLKRSK